jgi:ribosomal protein L16 Arg81 hydroxylase
MNFYEAATQRNEGMECVTESGDIIFVPPGWWHMVINLEPSVAITQNYVSRNNIRKVMSFLRGMSKSISGIGEEEGLTDDQLQERQRNFSREFEQSMQKSFPEVIQSIHEAAALRQEQNDRKRARPFAMEQAGSEDGFSFEF